MRRCRCCRQTWPLEFYKLDRARGSWRSPTCNACRMGCKRFAQRYYARHRETCIERTRAWKARLRADVERVRMGRVA